MPDDHPTDAGRISLLEQDNRRLSQDNHLLVLERDGLRETVSHERFAMAGLGKAYGAQSQRMDLLMERFSTFEQAMGSLNRLQAEQAALVARLQADVERLQIERMGPGGA